MADDYGGYSRDDDNTALAFHEVCRSVFDRNSLEFVATNAPSRIVSSFEWKQQSLARFSLGVVSARILEQLRHPESVPETNSVSQRLRSLSSKARVAFQLSVCTLGRFGLEALRALRHGIPTNLRLLISAKILTNVGNLLVDNTLDIKEVPSEPLGGPAPPRIVNGGAHRGRESVVGDILRALNISLPNDFARLIFLSTLRDNNSGHYYHSDVARRFSVEVADRAMLACHQQVYEKVVSLQLEDLTEQLDSYLATIRVPKQRLIESWTKLRAYRATIPIDTDSISAEIFYMKVEVAVAILEARLPGRVH